MEFPVNDLIRLFKMASIGKVTGGLIHNINGPLQNIGLDLEMSQYMLRKESDDNGGTESSIMVRLKRIEEELDRLNNMIKTSSHRITHSDNGLQNFNEFLELELAFLKTNLYYKHNVETILQLDAPPPLTSLISENSTLAFGWLLQKVIEEVENRKGKKLLIKTEKVKGIYKISIEAEITDLRNSINEISKNNNLASDKLSARENESDLLLILKIFHADGIVVESGKGKSSKLAITFPVEK